MIVSIYRKYVNEEFRDYVYDKFLGSLLLNLRNFKEYRKALFFFLFGFLRPSTEQNKLYAYMGKHGLSVFPYPFSRKYKDMPVQLEWDKEKEMHYVVHEDKNLYFPNEYSRKRIKEVYRSLREEQDIESPHQYIKDAECIEGRCLLDIGAAEGIFTLTHIDKLKKAYLFECEDYWIEALKNTFAPWKDKVEIISKYVGDEDSELFTTLDTFMEDKNKNDIFLKMDIEGFELKALFGAKQLMASSPDIRFAICTYHREEDAEQIARFLDAYKLNYEFTDGFMYFEESFRKGMIRSSILK